MKTKFKSALILLFLGLINSALAESITCGFQNTNNSEIRYLSPYDGVDTNSIQEGRYRDYGPGEILNSKELVTDTLYFSSIILKTPYTCLDGFSASETSSIGFKSESEREFFFSIMGPTRFHCDGSSLDRYHADIIMQYIHGIQTLIIKVDTELFGDSLLKLSLPIDKARFGEVKLRFPLKGGVEFFCQEL